MKALLIIDMQKGSFKPYSLRHDTLGTVERINAVAKHCRDNNIPVIFIQHDGSNEQHFFPGSEDWELLPELEVHSGDLMVSKTANDAFYKTRLDTLLKDKNITELLISGCATDFCIDTTVKSAHNKDYKVTVLADAHTTASRPFVDAPTLINHYNWLWNDLSPTRYKIAVVKTNEVVVLP